ncbi:MAG: 3'-5' exonuclease domain-containing protein 2 [Muribaculaceae bacterium]|nr:3'-5' exonuclease domain-containing protein 2 [Muribaculaceae bacterium]
MVDNISKAKIAIRAIKKHRLIGFDTETKPSFKRGQTNKVALLQLSTGAHCYLFRLTVPGIYEMIRPILEDQEIRKIGLSIHDDFNALRRRGELNPQGFLDLQDYCKSFFIDDISLQKIFAILFHEKISKSQRLTNWEAESLNESQQIYAAIDAWACLKIYNFLKSGDFNPYEVSSMFYSD